MIKIVKKEDCCGCYSCANRCPKNCINMHEDDEGFVYPAIDSSLCIDCGICEEVCPVLNQGDKRIPLVVLASKSNSINIRTTSSSGGMFTLLAEEIIKKGGVVFGARFDDKNEVIHDFTEELAGLDVFKGSKYVQSNIIVTYRAIEKFLQQRRYVLFTGTPCQVLALKLYLRKTYNNLFTVDFVCHGVPSPKVWRKYLSLIKMNFSISEIIKINFRDKKLGWRNFSFALDFSHKGKTIHMLEPQYINCYMRGFLHDLYLRPSCYHCPSRNLKSGSDITLGDYWGKVDDAFFDDKGISLVLLNTKSGIDLFETIDCEKILSTYEDALSGNKAIETSCVEPANRKIFYSQFEKIDFCKLIRKLTKMTFREYMKSYYLYLRLKLSKI